MTQGKKGVSYHVFPIYWLCLPEEKGITPFLSSHTPYSLLLLLLFHVKPPLGERTVGSPPPLLFPFLLDPGIQLGDGADAPDGVLNSL